MRNKQDKVSRELESTGFKFCRYAEHPNIMMPVVLHECDEKTYILVEYEGAISIVNKDDLSYSANMPPRVVEFFLKTTGGKDVS